MPLKRIKKALKGTAAGKSSSAREKQNAMIEALRKKKKRSK
tara:strand:+ start:376 stop:498 length:123 start_codon:yes stop_codon:yes gene_type:complete